MTTSRKRTPDLPEVDLADAMMMAAQSIRRALAGLAPGSCLTLDGVVKAFRAVERVSEARKELRAKATAHYGPKLNQAYSEYRSALTDWDRHLPRLHGWLLAERSRLSARSGHAQSVREWLDTNNFLSTD